MAIRNAQCVSVGLYNTVTLQWQKPGEQAHPTGLLPAVLLLTCTE